jgi:hypothetical protein
VAKILGDTVCAGLAAIERRHLDQPQPHGQLIHHPPPKQNPPRPVSRLNQDALWPLGRRDEIFRIFFPSTVQARAFFVVPG